MNTYFRIRITFIDKDTNTYERIFGLYRSMEEAYSIAYDSREELIRTLIISSEEFELTQCAIKSICVDEVLVTQNKEGQPEHLLIKTRSEEELDRYKI